MSPPTYERLPQEGVHETELSRAAPSRPSTYYGDGSFDPQSSDDEAENLLEKNGAPSPGMVERGRLDFEEDQGEDLVVGGQKQRQSSLQMLIYSLAALILLAGVC
jgi:dipeptidyl aminopeptidase B